MIFIYERPWIYFSNCTPLKLNYYLKFLFRGKKSLPNLSRSHRFALDYLRRQKDFVTGACDKNLGPFIIERDQYIDMAFRDHLNDSSTYQRLDLGLASLYTYENREMMESWLTRHKEELNDQEWKYLDHHFHLVEDPMPYFYLLMKVHKTPLKTRPIVSFSGSLFHSLGVWVDTYLQKVAKFEYFD